MQIVIEIPKYKWIENIEDFKSAVKEYEQGSRFDHAIRKALLLGKPLPKHHGRLIDAKDVGEYLTLADVPTIIEADKEV